MIVRTQGFKWKNDPLDYLLIACVAMFLISLVLTLAGSNPNRALAILAGVLTAISALALFMKNSEYGSQKAYVVTFDGKEIRCSHPKQSYGSVFVNDILEIGVLTTDDGPIAPDVWIMLLDRDGLACTFPSDAEGHKSVIDHLLTFEGFDHRTFIEAMGSTSDAKFVVWQKPAKMN